MGMMLEIRCVCANLPARSVPGIVFCLPLWLSCAVFSFFFEPCTGHTKSAPAVHLLHLSCPSPFSLCPFLLPIKPLSTHFMSFDPPPLNPPT
jgi:hypothetical protein